MCSRPAVSTMSTSKPRALAFSQASWATLAGSLPCWFLTISQPSRWLQMVSCSTAAARKVSQAATITFLPSSWQRRASLAIDVVLPEPLTPATMITVGPAGVVAQSAFVGALSSSLSCCLTKASTSPVISLSRNAWRTRSTISAGGGGADVGQVELLLSSLRNSRSTRPLRRNSEATPVKTVRVLARPCLILSKRPRNTICSPQRPAICRSRSTPPRLSRMRRPCGGRSGPWQSLPPVMARRKRAARSRRAFSASHDSPGIPPQARETQSTEFSQHSLTAIIRRVRPGRNAARTADQGHGLLRRYTVLWHRNAAAVL